MLFDVLKLKRLTDYHYCLPKPLRIWEPQARNQRSEPLCLPVLLPYPGISSINQQSCGFIMTTGSHFRFSGFAVCLCDYFTFMKFFPHCFSTRPDLLWSVLWTIPDFVSHLNSNCSICSVVHTAIKCLLTFFLLFSLLLFVFYYYLTFHMLMSCFPN